MIAPNDAQQCYHDDDIGLASLVDHNPEDIANTDVVNTLHTVTLKPYDKQGHSDWILRILPVL